MIEKQGLMRSRTIVVTLGNKYLVLVIDVFKLFVVVWLKSWPLC